MEEKIFYSEYFYERGSQDTDVLQKNANEYPLSSLASFLLLYHYKKTAHPDFEKQAKKTVLLFSNPHWLQFQLHHQPIQKAEQEVLQPVSVPVEEESHVLIESNNEQLHEISSAQNFIDETGDSSIEKNEYTHDAEMETSHELMPAEITESSDESYAEKNQLAEQEDDLPAINFQTIELAEKDPDAETEAIAFEPLHTVDYFASQGIKIDEELLTNDKLSSQMKSFTEWLKSMKKLHPSKLEEQSNATERLIQNAADASNINTEILTEAMAEVLIKQNKKEKAIEMFSKLSLINPSKSAYFAAKIESIKSS